MLSASPPAEISPLNFLNSFALVGTILATFSIIVTADMVVLANRWTPDRAEQTNARVWFVFSSD
jgi:hypothetical protein